MEIQSASNSVHERWPVLVDVILWVLRRRRRLRVSGDSMYPTICEGDMLFIDQGAYASCIPQVDEIVVARHPYIKDLLLVKRVRAVHHNGSSIEVAGDNPQESTDSRGFGNLDSKALVGRVSSVWKKK